MGLTRMRSFLHAVGLVESFWRPCQCAAPNLALEPTPDSLCSSVASAIGRGSPRALEVFILPISTAIRTYGQPMLFMLVWSHEQGAVRVGL